MSEMFCDFFGLNEIDISNFITEKVKKIWKVMESMFKNC